MFAVPRTEFSFQSLSMRLLTVNISCRSPGCAWRGGKTSRGSRWTSRPHTTCEVTPQSQLISPVHQHRYHHLQHHYRNLDKAPRLSIRIDIWILLSDTDTICQLNQFNTNSEAAMLSTHQYIFRFTIYHYQQSHSP